MKKGLLIIPYLKGYGGTETVINSLLNQFDNDDKGVGISLETYSFGGTDDNWWLNHKNMNILKYPKNKYLRTIMFMLTLPILIPKILIEKKPDFVLFTNPIMWFISNITCKIFNLNTRTIAWYHYSYDLKPIKPFLLKSADNYFTISATGKKELVRKGIDPDKIYVVYNPVIPSDKIIRHSEKCNVFLYVGRTEYGNQKNISELFRALAKLDNSDWKLINYGVGPDRQKLKELSISLGIEKNIYWMGFEENVFDKIKEADALVLTSNFEGFSMVIAEAISHGLFAISSDCPSGPSELINKDNGILYKLGDIDALTNNLTNTINGENCVDYEVIKNSISKLYINHYFERFIKCLNDL